MKAERSSSLQNKTAKKKAININNYAKDVRVHYSGLWSGGAVTHLLVGVGAPEDMSIVSFMLLATGFG